MIKTSIAKFKIGQVIRHRVHAFRGVVFDVDAEFAGGRGTSESILVELRSRRDQPFYYLLAENDQNPYVAYVSEQNLLLDTSGEPVRHPQLDELFECDENGSYRSRNRIVN
jgi:heat shock protein HspQ